MSDRQSLSYRDRSPSAKPPCRKKPVGGSQLVSIFTTRSSPPILEQLSCMPSAQADR